MFRRHIACVALVCTTMLVACGSQPRIEEPSGRRRATAQELQRVGQEVYPRAREMAQQARDILGPSYDASVTTRVGPEVDENDCVEIVYAITVWQRDSPSIRLVVRQYASSDGLGSGGESFGGGALRTLSELAALPTAWQAPMVRYLAATSLASTNTLAIDLLHLKGAAAAADYPPVGQLVAAVRESGYEPSQCVDVQFLGQSRRDVLVAYDVRSGSWITLATREGEYPEAFTLATSSP